MNEEQFKQQFIVTFLATWAATNYDFCVSHGQHERLGNPPVEDAEFLADRAWATLQELCR
jgi:hypothetical protein